MFSKSPWLDELKSWLHKELSNDIPRICSKSNTTGVTSGAGTPYPSEHMSPPGFSSVRIDNL